MTDLRKMTLLGLADYYEVNNLPAGTAREIEAELSRRQSMLTASDHLHKLLTDYLAWDLAAPGKQHAVERWKARCRMALAEYNKAKGER